MFKYYIIKTIGEKSEVYGDTGETKKLIRSIIIKSTICKSNKGKKINLNKNSITKNLSQFDFTLTFDQ